MIEMNRFNRILGILFLATITAACTGEAQPSGSPDQARESKAGSSPLIPGSMIVEVSDELADELASGALQTRSGELNSAFALMGATSVRRLYPDAGEWEPRHRKAGLHKWFIVNYDPDAVPATKAAEGLSEIPGVLLAKPQRRIRQHSYFNDPRAGSQWALSESAYGINVQPVWDIYTAGKPEVIVAVIDGGIQMDHPDLAAVCVPAGSDGSKSFVNGHVGYYISPHRHGTHVAGIIGAINNNGEGVSSIAGGDDGKGGVRLLSCATFMDNPEDPEKSLTGDSYNALVWAADHGAVIANNSWGYDYENEYQALSSNANEYAPAVDYFIEFAGCDKHGKQRPDSPMKGGLVVFAAGNESWSMAWPAALPQVVAVGATGQNGEMAYYSNYGNWVDICAPGGDVKSGSGILSTINGSSYGSLQGTSMACPHVAGVAALLVSYYGGPGFTCDMLKERLLKGANTKKAPGKIGPFLDAMGSFTYGGTQPPKAPEHIEASVSANSVTLSWNVTEDPDDIKALGYLMVFTEGETPMETLVFMNGLPLNAITKKIETGRLKVGDPISGVMTGLKFNTTYNATVIAYDYRGHYSRLPEILKVTTGENNPPYITPPDTEAKIKAHKKLYLSFGVTDPDGHKVTMKIDGGSDAFRAEAYQGEVKVTITGIDAPPGKYKATLTATDEFGLSASCDYEYTILPNHVPVLIKNAENIVFGAKDEVVNLKLSDYIYDEDEEPLYYKTSYSDDSVAKVSINGNNIIIRATGYGLTTVNVIANDISKSTCELDFKVLVRDPSRPVDLFPNPVKTKLSIRPGTEGSLEVAVRNKAGSTVHSGSGDFSPLDPMEIDMTNQPAGTYYVTIKGCGADGCYTIVKI